MADDGTWRFCSSCQAMFVIGKGQSVCPQSGGAHVAQGYSFIAPGRGRETDHRQDGWTRCDKCAGIFYLGHVRDDITDDDDDLAGACPGGGKHHRSGYEQESLKPVVGPVQYVMRKPSYTLPFDVPETNSSQPKWRRCKKCRTLVYDADGTKGHCPAGGAHDNYDGPTHKSFSIDFVLPEVFVDIHTDSDSPYFWVRGRKFTVNSSGNDVHTAIWNLQWYNEASNTASAIGDNVSTLGDDGSFSKDVPLPSSALAMGTFKYFVEAKDNATGLTSRSSTHRYPA